MPKISAVVFKFSETNQNYFKGTQDVEALSDEGFGESSTIERMEKDGTLTQNAVSPKKNQDEDKYVDGLSSSNRKNKEISENSM